MTDLVRDFRKLFKGNPDAYGLCTPGIAPTAQRLPVNNDVWCGHLYGAWPIGIYPIMPANNAVVWGCVDIDLGYEGSRVHALNLRAVLREFGITGWMERSLSKGYHVWVFTWGCTADLMRNALKAACAIAGAPDKEVNPKQESLAPGQLGNFVRIPYPHHWHESQYVTEQGLGVPTNWSLGADEFVGKALAARSDLGDLPYLYTPPVRPPIEKRLVTGFNGPIGYRERMSGLTWTIYNDGPLDGSDRSGTMFKLACRLRDEGFTTGEAFELLSDYDYRHGKFGDRPDRDQRLEELVLKAFVVR